MVDQLQNNKDNNFRCKPQGKNNIPSHKISVTFPLFAIIHRNNSFHQKNHGSVIMEIEMDNIFTKLSN